MTLQSSSIKARLLCLCLFMGLTACSISEPSKNSNLHVLSSRSMPGTEQTTPELSFVVVGPVIFADYLNRSAVMTRQQTQVKQAKFDVWAGALDEEFHIALVKNLSAHLPRQVVVRYPTQVKAPNSRRLVIDVLQFDSGTDDTARLEAVWGWLSPEGELLAGGNYANQVTSGDSAEQITQALSQLVDEFSIFLAQRVTMK